MNPNNYKPQSYTEIKTKKERRVELPHHYYITL